VDNQLRTRPPYTVTPRRGRSPYFLFPSYFIPTRISTSSLFLSPLFPHPFLFFNKCSMACPFPQASERHPTPPLSPSTSSGSSRESSAPSLSPSPLSTLLPRDINVRLRPYPDSQPLEHCDRTSQLGLMPDRLDDDTVMLDDWEENEHERPERVHGEQILEIV